jgi:hypothetical protein
MRLSTLVTAAVAVVAVGSPAGAQFVQYTPPGSLAIQAVPTKVALETAMKDAQWTLGTLRIAPWLGLQDFTYYNDVNPNEPGNQSDYSATIGAGLTLFQPFSPRFTLVAQALPEYVWWKNESGRRLWNGRYGVGVFGYFNRLTLEVNGDKVRQQGYVNDQVQVPVNVQGDKGKALLEVKIFERLSVYGSGEATRWRYRNQDLPGAESLSDLDRNETVAGGGLRYEFRPGFSIKAGVQHSKTDFVNSSYDRSNSGDGPTVGIEFKGAHLGLSGTWMRYSLKPTAGSQFTSFDGGTGSGRLSWTVREGLVWSVYESRQLSYGYGSGNPYYLSRRTGLGLQLPLGWRGSALLFAEKGTNDYAGSITSASSNEDVKSYGVQASVRVGRLGALNLGFTRENYDTSDGGSRAYTRVQGGLSFGGGAPALW